MISWPPDEVERRFALLGIRNRFTPEEKERLQTTNIVTPPGNIIRFSTPADNSGLNLLNLRNLLGTNPSQQPAFFDHPWYLEEAFAKVNCLPGWHCLYSEVLQDSVSQPVQYAHSLLSRKLMLPSAIEVILMLFLNYAGSREQLLQKKHTWCSDQASQGRWVTVGAFGRNGLFVSGHPPGFASRGLGICGKMIDNS
jgi:hypothetical protein